MANVFVVRAADSRKEPEKIWSGNVNLAPLVGVGAASVWVYLRSGLKTPGPADWLIILLSTMLFSKFWPHRESDRAVCVRVSPVGIQIYTQHSSGQHIDRPIFLLRQDVLDCIVREVILAHRILNVALFRVQLNSGVIQMVEAFPGVDLTYAECLTIRNEINKSLRPYLEPRST